MKVAEAAALKKPPAGSMQIIIANYIVPPSTPSSS